jgi:hypothetical protein
MKHAPRDILFDYQGQECSWLQRLQHSMETVLSASSSSSSSNPSPSTASAKTGRNDSCSDSSSMEETAMERTPGIVDDSVADPGFVGSSADTGKENGSGTSRTTPRRHGGVFSGYENEKGQRYLISYVVSCCYTCCRTRGPRSERADTISR